MIFYLAMSIALLTGAEQEYAVAMNVGFNCEGAWRGTGPARGVTSGFCCWKRLLYRSPYCHFLLVVPCLSGSPTSESSCLSAILTRVRLIYSEPQKSKPMTKQRNGTKMNNGTRQAPVSIPTIINTTAAAQPRNARYAHGATRHSPMALMNAITP